MTSGFEMKWSSSTSKSRCLANETTFDSLRQHANQSGDQRIVNLPWVDQRRDHTTHSYRVLP